MTATAPDDGLARMRAEGLTPLQALECLGLKWPWYLMPPTWSDVAEAAEETAHEEERPR